MKSLIFFIITIIFLVTNAYADDIQSSIFWERFNDEFPPDGWDVLSTSPYDNWIQADNFADGKIVGFEGENDKFAFIKSRAGVFSHETLITKEHHLKETPIETPGYPDLYYWLHFALAWKSPIPFGNDFEVVISEDYYIKEAPTWESIFSLQKEQFKPDFIKAEWKKFELCLDDLGDTDIVIGFKYVGIHNHELGLDNVLLKNTYKNPDEDNHNNNDDGDAPPADDDVDDDDDAKDADPVVDVDDNDDGQCGCDVSDRMTTFPLVLGMFLIGLCAWIYSRKKN